MPKKDTDYSKTIFYKICCNDTNIKDIYVGRTTDLIKRKNYHKGSYYNVNDKNHHNLKVYKFIRDNGGWDNWNVIPIEVFPCENKYDAIIRERYWYEALKATLNSDIPARKGKEYYKDNKDIILAKAKHYVENHKEKLKDLKHTWYESKKETLKEKINCVCGSVVCKYSYNLHLKSLKHTKFLQKEDLDQ